MITFGTNKAESKSKWISAVRRWVEDALPPEYEEANVMVAEMRCYEPGCAPLETVVTLIDPSKPAVPFKVFKPVSEVRSDEVVAALEAALAGRAAPHMQLPK